MQSKILVEQFGILDIYRDRMVKRYEWELEKCEEYRWRKLSLR